MKGIDCSFYSNFGTSEALYKAAAFTFSHPLAEYSAFDKNGALLAPPTVFIIGFGGVGRGTLFSSVSAEQFYFIDGDSYKEIPIKYVVFDDGNGEEYLADGLLRYEQGISGFGEDYLPLPAVPAVIDRQIFDGKSIKSIVPAVCAEKNSIVRVACDDERSGEALADSIRLALSRSDIPVEVVRDCGREFMNMAFMRYCLYRNGDREALAEAYEAQADSKRESNLFACLSLRSKLIPFGFDLTKKSDKRKDASAEFKVRYTTVREIMTRQEHQRWNAFTFACGYIPASVGEFLSKDKSTLEKERKHANLTTFEGLKKYAEIISESRGISLDEADVIKYDCQLLDDADKLADVAGYKIVFR